LKYHIALFSSDQIAADDIQLNLKNNFKHISWLTKSAFKNLESTNVDAILQNIIPEKQEGGDYSEKSLKRINPNKYSTSRWKWIWSINKTIDQNRTEKILKEIFMQ
jgi:hypothetical protein